MQNLFNHGNGGVCLWDIILLLLIAAVAVLFFVRRNGMKKEEKSLDEKLNSFEQEAAADGQ